MSPRPKTNRGSEALRTLALRYPDTDEGIACEGTPLESRTIRARKKAFLFLGHKGEAWQVRLKLSASQGEATKLAAKEPDRYKVGANGWVLAVFGPDDRPPVELLERWIEESYRTIVGDGGAVAKKPVRKMDAAEKRAPATRGKSKRARASR